MGGPAKPFWSRVHFGPSCWEWVGSRCSDGYGTRWDPETRKTLTTHRISWSMENGEIPRGMCVLHRCDNPPCVRPDHLFLGTQSENVADRQAKGRCRAGSRQLEKTHCPSGHPYSGANLYVWNNLRLCRICRRAKVKINDAKRRQKEQA